MCFRGYVPLLARGIASVASLTLLSTIDPPFERVHHKGSEKERPL